MTPQVTYCSQSAFKAFQAHLPQIETVNGLILAASSLALHRKPEQDISSVVTQIDGIAAQIRARVKRPTTDALIAHMHEVLFSEMGFEGNTDDYYSEENSYLPCVLQNRRGLPIILALIYKAVGQKLGLQADGIHSPFHFLAQVHGSRGPMLIDVFFHGQYLTREQAFERLEQMSGRAIPHDDRLLQPANHRQWILRILANLENAFAMQGNHHDLSAMHELSQLFGDNLLH